MPPLSLPNFLPLSLIILYPSINLNFSFLCPTNISPFSPLIFHPSVSLNSLLCIILTSSGFNRPCSSLTNDFFSVFCHYHFCSTLCHSNQSACLSLCRSNFSAPLIEQNKENMEKKKSLSIIFFFITPLLHDILSLLPSFFKNLPSSLSPHLEILYPSNLEPLLSPPLLSSTLLLPLPVSRTSVTPDPSSPTLIFPPTRQVDP